jgi:hypothetical protein
MKQDIFYNDKVIGYIKISQYNDFINIDDIQVFKSGTKSGTKAILEMINKAKEENKIITLTSDAMRGKDNQKKNRNLYLSLGFIKNSGKNKIKNSYEEFYILPN